MDQDGLTQLREKILADIMPLVISTSENGADRFGVLLRVIQAGNAPQEIYDKAYQSAQAIDDNDEKLNALMSLLDEVELDIDQTNQPQSEEVHEEPQQPVHEPAEDAPVYNEEYHQQ